MTAPEQPPRDDVGELPDGVEREVALAPLTTVRTGGAARFFARPESAAALVELLAWARERQVPIAVIGSGSNLLVADAGFEGLALKLAGSLTGIERDGERVTCGGGMRLPSAAAKTAGWGLAGLEFGVNIPGTVGGSVRMNANAYGGQLSRALEWVEICTPDGPVRRRPEQLGFTYRDSALAA
ncbi:MAG TPA: FAD-binding protein, partial [Solirubrobacterales bacterium]|nr:FAD-binding protein [Solirubrobacterales bacterium]